MKKRWSLILLAAMLLVALAGCGETQGDVGGSASPNEPTQTAAPETSEEPSAEPTKVTLDIEGFDELLEEMPLHVISTKYVVQDEKYKSLYPDMLQAVIQNDTASDIKNAVVAFVAWDKNGLPVKLKGSIDFSDGTYIKQVQYSDINLVPGETYGESSGFSIDEECGVETFKAVVMSFETFEGDEWENPYYNAWRKMYEGVKYSEELTVEVKKVEVNFEAASNGNTTVEKAGASEEELLSQIEQQEVRVISTKYVVQNAKYKSLYPDMLQAVVQNDSTADIKDAVVAFVAWDKNGLPVKLKGDIDFSDGSYIKQVAYSDINLVPGETYGESSGFSIDEECGVETFRAIVVSYETFEGESWKNPVYNSWCELYEGVKQTHE